jgi:hypothetical protein
MQFKEQPVLLGSQLAGVTGFAIKSISSLELRTLRKKSFAFLQREVARRVLLSSEAEERKHLPPRC